MSALSEDIRSALSDAPLCPLGPGRIDLQLADRLRGRSAQECFPDATIVDGDSAEACLAGLWLRANDLDTGHGICQASGSALNAYWHGIMHRREGDHGNADYWFRRAGATPALDAIADAVRGCGGAAADLVDADGWDPHAFNRVVERLRNRDEGDDEAAIMAQHAEWRALMTWSAQQAGIDVDF